MFLEIVFWYSGNLEVRQANLWNHVDTNLEKNAQIEQLQRFKHRDTN